MGRPSHKVRLRTVGQDNDGEEERSWDLRRIDDFPPKVCLLLCRKFTTWRPYRSVRVWHVRPLAPWRDCYLRLINDFYGLTHVHVRKRKGRGKEGKGFGGEEGQRGGWGNRGGRHRIKTSCAQLRVRTKRSERRFLHNTENKPNVVRLNVHCKTLTWFVI